MEIEEYGRARFLVKSHGRDHLVDLITFDGNGACTCVHFLSRLKPAITEARRLRDFAPADCYRCPHIRKCRELLLDRFIVELMKKYPDNEDI